MTTSLACKTSYATPPSGQYVSEPVNVIVGQKGCDQGAVVSSEFNLMEMTEVEYTHLQQLIQSHMEAQDGAEEVRLNSSSCEFNSCKEPCPCPCPYTSPACQPGASSSLSSSLSSSRLPTDTQFVPLPSNQVCDDSQEVKMLLYSDPSSISSLAESTPTSSGGAPSSVLAKKRCVMEVPRERTDYRKPFGSRPNPPARVCLEKRFDCSSCDSTKKQESQAAVLNTFLSMLHNTTEIPGISRLSEPVKFPAAERSGAVQSDHLYTGNQVGQVLGHSSQQLQGGKHPEGITTRNVSVSKTAELVQRSPCIIYADANYEEQVIDLQHEVVQKAEKRPRLRGALPLQALDPNIMQGSEKRKPACIIPGGKPARRTRPPLEVNQRRQRHNLKERDRRRRIRLCCDELNTLVPFCCPATDKATTLQWTTAYLKYIREVHGDSLKQNFQNTFSGKTRVRIKPSCSDDAPERENAASKE